jgi:hypothetical protein
MRTHVSDSFSLAVKTYRSQQMYLALALEIWWETISQTCYVHEQHKYHGKLMDSLILGSYPECPPS